MYFLIPKCPVRWWRTRIIFLSRFQRRGSIFFVQVGQTDFSPFDSTNKSASYEYLESAILKNPTLCIYRIFCDIRIFPDFIRDLCLQEPSFRHLFSNMDSPCRLKIHRLALCHIYPENLWTTSKHTDTAFLIQAALNSTVHWSCHCQWSDRDRFRSMSPPLHPLPPLYLPLSLSPDYNTVQSRPVLSAVPQPAIIIILKTTINTLYINFFNISPLMCHINYVNCETHQSVNRIVKKKVSLLPNYILFSTFPASVCKKCSLAPSCATTLLSFSVFLPESHALWEWL